MAIIRTERCSADGRKHQQDDGCRYQEITTQATSARHARILYVAGHFDAGEMKKAVATAFRGMEQEDRAASDQHAESENTARSGRYRSPGRGTIDLIVGLPVPDPTSPDAIPLMVTNALLGGSFGSRITSNIREQKGYTYSPTKPDFAPLSRRVLGGDRRM